MYVLITVNYNSATTSALMNTSATDHTPHHTHLTGSVSKWCTQSRHYQCSKAPSPTWGRA